MKPWLRKLRRIWVISGAVFTVLFIAYNLLSFKPSAEAREAERTDGSVTVTRAGERTSFAPAGERRPEALVFFAGALVDPAAYAPLMRRLAERGYLAVTIGLPGRAAPTRSHEMQAIRSALEVIEGTPSARWVVGGHSKGGAIAAMFAGEHPERLSGLLLVGTSHPRELDLSGLAVPVTKVSGSRDGLASSAEVREFASNLPRHTKFVEVPGGNHAQFGYYGYQIGDRRAKISRSEQQERLLEAVLALMTEISVAPEGGAGSRP